VTGTLTSRLSTYNAEGIESRGADNVEPGCGGGSVRGSLLGGNWNRDFEGRLNWTVGKGILDSGWTAGGAGVFDTSTARFVATNFVAGPDGLERESDHATCLK